MYWLLNMKEVHLHKIISYIIYGLCKRKRRTGVLRFFCAFRFFLKPELSF